MAGRATGSSHLRIGAPCQDRFECRADGGWLFAAAADGAGSAPLSEYGAELAVRTAVDAMARARRDVEDPETLVRSAASEARSAVLDLAASDGRDVRDYACTLLLLLLGPAGGAAAQIGDGVIAVKADEDGWSWVFWPQKGEFANVTRFLTEDGLEERLESAGLGSDVQELALLTDGLEPLALHYASKTAHTPFFEGFAQKLRAAGGTGENEGLSNELRSFLSSPRLAERVDDDLTLVVAARA